MNEVKTYTCRRMRLLSYLCENGFQPIKTLPYPANPRYNVWLFDREVEGFEDTLKTYFDTKMSKQ